MIRKFSLIAMVTIAAIACNTDENKPKENTDGFDRSALLINMADNIIIPAHQDLDSKLTDLVTAKDAFIASTNQLNLDNLRASWLSAYKTWQCVEMFNIGKAEEIQYYYQMNIYPTNATEIQSNITSGTYDLTHVNNFDAVGFPALDYLLYGVAATDDAILEKYVTDSDATNHKAYLADIVDQMKSLTATILTDWTGGTYRNTFVNSTDNTASSAANSLVNDIIFYYEKGLRANKIGTPAGVYSATPLPDKVEAFHNKNISEELALEALKAVQDIFNGKHYNSNSSGESFKSYLESLDKSDLASSINSQFDIARQKIQIMDASFYAQINSDNTKMTEAFDALQSAVVLLKVDMLHAFNINIDYVDGDGD